MGDKSRGLYKKFTVERTDGSSVEGGKHHDCEYFVLDLTHDPHAVPALQAYAEAARRDGYEALADDLETRFADYGVTDGPVGDGRYCRHHDDDPAHGPECYELHTFDFNGD